MPRLHRSRLATALVASLAVILSSPFVGDIRSALITAFPAQCRLIGSAIAAVVVVALGWARRGDEDLALEFNAVMELATRGWARDNPAFRQYEIDWLNFGAARSAGSILLEHWYYG